MMRKWSTAMMVLVVVAASMVAAAGLAPVRVRAMSVPIVSTGVDLTCTLLSRVLRSARDATMPVNSGRAVSNH